MSGYSIVYLEYKLWGNITYYDFNQLIISLMHFNFEQLDPIQNQYFCSF